VSVYLLRDLKSTVWIETVIIAQILSLIITNFAYLMIPAKKNKIIARLFSFYHNKLIKKHFYGIHLAGAENYRKIDPALPTVLYANHSNWWDGFISYFLTTKYFRADDYLMMDIRQMRKYRFFKYIGVFSVDRTNPREGVESINYACELLKSSTRHLWIYPQGIMQPQDKRPLVFYSGISHIAEKLENVNLVPVCLRYEFMLEQRPEVFIKIGEPDIISGSVEKDLTENLQNKFTKLLDGLRGEVTGGNTEGFTTIFTGISSRNKTVDKFYDK
jgi:chlorobactene lauroyltransferase